MCLAIPGRIVELVSGQSAAGIVEVAGVRRKVQLGLLADDMPVLGDWVLIHVGFAMSKISECDAAEQMRLLSMLGEAELAMEEVRGYGQADGVRDDSVSHPTNVPSSLRPKAERATEIDDAIR